MAEPLRNPKYAGCSKWMYKIPVFKKIIVNEDEATLFSSKLP